MIPADKRNIAFVASDARSLYLFRRNVMLELKKMGFRIHFVAPHSVFATKLVRLGFEFHHIPLQPYNLDFAKEVKLIYHLYRMYKDHSIAMAFHYTAKMNIYGSFAAGRLGIPSIAVQTGLGELPLLKPGFRRFLVHQLYRTALRFTKEAWFLNRKDRNYFLKHGLAPIHKMRRLPGEGIDLDYYKPIEVERQDNEIRFLFLGRLLRSKGVYEFVEVARKIRKKYAHAKFIIVGIFNLEHPSSIDTEALYKWQKQGIIEFLGEKMDVRPILASCDCLIHPSYYNEGMSRVLMEAAAMELPIITTDQVGCREIVKDKISGFIVPKNDVKALTEASEKVINMESIDRMVLGKNGRNHISANYKDKVVIELYKAILNIYLNVSLLELTKSGQELNRIN